MSVNTTRAKTPTMTTHESGVGYSPSDALELYLLVANTLIAGDSFYEKQATRLQRFEALVKNLNRSNPEFLAALAVYARDQLYLRSTPTLLTALMFKHGNPYARFAAEQVWLRGDEHLEAMAFFNQSGFPVSLLKAAKRRIEGMSAKSLLKYSLDGRAVSQRDAIRLAHPAIREGDTQLAVQYLLRGRSGLNKRDQRKLDSLREDTETWENIISEEGSTEAAWLRAIKTMGYMALLRNLRNIAEKITSPAVIANVAERIADPAEVARSKQLPFRFLSAVRALPSTRSSIILRDAVCDAANTSLRNLPKLDGHTVVLVDYSKSMQDTLSDKSGLRRADVASLFAAMLFKAYGAHVYGFSVSCWAIPLSKHATVIQTSEKALRTAKWGATQTGAALEHVIRDNPNADRIVVITDEQTGDDAISPVRRWLRKGRHLHVINVAGYEPLMTPEHTKGIHRVGGWSDKALQWMEIMERGFNAQELVSEYGPERKETSRATKPRAKSKNRHLARA